MAATRMELLRLKKKSKLAAKGHKLLKEKRDALVSEFFTLIDGLMQKRKSFEEELAQAYQALIVAEAVAGREEIVRAADASNAHGTLATKHKTIMGVDVPMFSLAPVEKSNSYSTISSPVALDEAREKFKECLQLVVDLAETETTVRRLAEEIKKTKRKVNSLEQIVIPRLEKEIRYIKVHLEEMERENFSRLKIIKGRM